MSTKFINTPLSVHTVENLFIGDQVYISGTIITGRDAAHKRLVESLQAGEKLPFELKDQIIYYVGPAPAKPGQVIGSAGPTTSGRMDAYTPFLLRHGLRGMIGKGSRNDDVKDALIKHKAVYFTAVGGAAAFTAQKIKKAEVLLYPDLGPEAVYQLYVEDLPVIVTNDCHGGDLYLEGTAKYKKVLNKNDICDGGAE